jgi:hypothetical protein
MLPKNSLGQGPYSSCISLYQQIDANDANAPPPIRLSQPAQTHFLLEPPHWWRPTGACISIIVKKAENEVGNGTCKLSDKAFLVVCQIIGVGPTTRVSAMDRVYPFMYIKEHTENTE